MREDAIILWSTGLVFLMVVVISVVLQVTCWLPSRFTSNTLSRLCNTPVIPDAGPGIPKIIWTYWNSDKLPPFVQLCVNSWRWHNPEFEVRVVTPSTVSKYINVDVKLVPWNDGPTRESDIIRINILAEHGGVWSDASILLLGPYDFKHAMASRDFLGYYIQISTRDMRYPVIENWFFATAPRGSFITKWRDVFMDPELGKNMDERLANLMSTGVDVQNIQGLKYLFMHLCAQYVLQKVLSPKQVADLVLAKAEDGPFKFLDANNWNNMSAVRELVRHPGLHGHIYKLRGCERPFVLDTDIASLTDAVKRSIKHKPSTSPSVFSSLPVSAADSR
jgi:hypothetical protein